MVPEDVVATAVVGSMMMRQAMGVVNVSEMMLLPVLVNCQRSSSSSIVPERVVSDVDWMHKEKTIWIVVSMLDLSWEKSPVDCEYQEW